MDFGEAGAFRPGADHERTQFGPQTDPRGVADPRLSAGVRVSGFTSVRDNNNDNVDSDGHGCRCGHCNDAGSADAGRRMRQRERRR